MSIVFEDDDYEARLLLEVVKLGEGGVYLAGLKQYVRLRTNFPLFRSDSAGLFLNLDKISLPFHEISE